MNIILISAMPEEIGNAVKELKVLKEHIYGDLNIYTGKWFGKNIQKETINVSLAWSGWGKVAAARTITRLISHASNIGKIDLIIFTGVAGSLEKNLKQWDVIIADSLVFNDIDTRPFFAKYEIPSLKKSEIKSNQKITNWANSNLLRLINEKKIPFFKVLKRGLICTGDTFISDKNQLKEFLKDFPKTLAVEMEGASIAQVAMQEKIPSLIVRVISDSADSESSYDFPTFINSYKNYSWYIIEALLKNLDNAPL